MLTTKRSNCNHLPARSSNSFSSVFGTLIVGKGRSNPKGITATGVVDTGTSNSTVPKNVTGKENMNVTWADVVRTKAPKAATSEAMKNSVLGDRKFVSKIILSKQSRY